MASTVSLTTNELVSFWKRTDARLNIYVWQGLDGEPETTQELGGEACLRSRQSLLALEWIQSLQNNLIERLENQLPPPWYSNEIEILTEAFYHTAWRLRLVLRELPGFNKYDPIGLRTVRNNILVHPKTFGRVFPRMFSIDSNNGPTYKYGQNYQDPTPIDLGLLSNATEIVTALANTLDQFEQKE